MTRTLFFTLVVFALCLFTMGTSVYKAFLSYEERDYGWVAVWTTTFLTALDVLERWSK